MLSLSLFHIVPKTVHLEDFVSLQNQVRGKPAKGCLSSLMLAISSTGVFVVSSRMMDTRGTETKLRNDDLKISLSHTKRP